MLGRMPTTQHEIGRPCGQEVDSVSASLAQEDTKHMHELTVKFTAAGTVPAVVTDAKMVLDFIEMIEQTISPKGAFASHRLVLFSFPWTSWTRTEVWNCADAKMVLVFYEDDHAENFANGRTCEEFTRAV